MLRDIRGQGGGPGVRVARLSVATEATEQVGPRGVKVRPAAMLGDVQDDQGLAPLPVGRGALEAEAMTSGSGDHAVLVRQADTPRVLLLAEPGDGPGGGLERVVIMPFDEDVETRVDGDALATWIAAPYATPGPEGEARVPGVGQHVRVRADHPGRGVDRDRERGGLQLAAGPGRGVMGRLPGRLVARDRPGVTG